MPEGVAIEPGQEPSSSYFGVTPHLLKTLNVPLVAGRDFTDADGQGRSGVAIVNGAFAKRLWPNRTDVIGQRFRLLDDKQDQWITVIGVVGDFRLFAVRDRKPQPYAFLSYPYDPARNTGLTMRVAGGAPAAIRAPIRQEIQQGRSDAAAVQHAERGGGAAGHASGSSGCSAGCSRSSARLRWCWHRLASTACCRMRYRSGRRRSASAWRSAPAAQNVFALIVSQARELAGDRHPVRRRSAPSPSLAWSRSLLYNVSATDPFSFVATAVSSR